MPSLNALHIFIYSISRRQDAAALGARSAGSVAHPCAQRLWMPVLVQRPSPLCVDPAKKICSVNFRPFSVGKERSECGNEFRVSTKSHNSSNRLFFITEGWGGGAARKKNGGILGDTELSQQNSTILRAVSRFLSLN